MAEKVEDKQRRIDELMAEVMRVGGPGTGAMVAIVTGSRITVNNWLSEELPAGVDDLSMSLNVIGIFLFRLMNLCGELAPMMFNDATHSGMDVLLAIQERMVEKGMIPEPAFAKAVQ